jgi:hypothetical protein
LEGEKITGKPGPGENRNEWSSAHQAVFGAGLKKRAEQPKISRMEVAEIIRFPVAFRRPEIRI